MVALITVIESMNRVALPHSPTVGRVCRAVDLRGLSGGVWWRSEFKSYRGMMVVS